MLKYCSNCDHEFTNVRCPRCGGLPTPTVPDHHPDDEHGKHEPVVLNTEGVSDSTDTLDTMIETASRPTLAQLLKRGVESGLITPTQEYSAGQVRT